MAIADPERPVRAEPLAGPTLTSFSPVAAATKSLYHAWFKVLWQVLGNASAKACLIAHPTARFTARSIASRQAGRMAQCKMVLSSAHLRPCPNASPPASAFDSPGQSNSRYESHPHLDTHSEPQTHPHIHLLIRTENHSKGDPSSEPDSVSLSESVGYPDTRRQYHLGIHR